MNIQQLRNAQIALRAAIAACEAKNGIEKAVSVVNNAWVDGGEPSPLPVGEYRRYSWLLADLTRLQMQTADHVRAEKSRDMLRKHNPDSDKLALLIDGVEELNEQLRLALMIENTGEMTYRVQGIRRALRVITDNSRG